jgi:DNA-binding LacI/PurR family transcriptional regulator
VRYLAALGHVRIAHVTGVRDFTHTVRRVAAFTTVMDELGLDAQVLETDYSADRGARATRRLLSSPEPPSAIIFDSDLLAVTGLGVAQQMGFTVPDDLSIVGWDDSLISQVVHPPLTAITRDIEAYGSTAARHLLEVIEGRTTGDVETARGELTPRGSTGRVRVRA